MKIKASEIKGFNYQPSYASCTLETWRNFDYEVICRELERGKKYFPKFNAARIWLSWNAYCRDGELFLDRVGMVLKECDSLGIYVVPVIFNRWHDPLIDCDGVYLDHLLPGSSWLRKYGNPFEGYVKALMERFGDDERILCWDICNEPFSFPKRENAFDLMDLVMPIEKKWLSDMYHDCKRFGAKQPLGIGDDSCMPLDYLDDICDVFMSHFYFRPDDPDDEAAKAEYEAQIKKWAEDAKRLGKEIFSNECGWGDFTDERRVKRLKVTLDVFKKYNMGYTLYALNDSQFTDLHDVSEGSLSPEIGNLCFVNKDGRLREGHGIFNEY